MSKSKIETLKEVNIRELWKYEWYDFWGRLDEGAYIGSFYLFSIENR